jgi:hypothetical protein
MVDMAGWAACTVVICLLSGGGGVVDAQKGVSLICLGQGFDAGEVADLAGLPRSSAWILFVIYLCPGRDRDLRSDPRIVADAGELTGPSPWHSDLCGAG